MNKNTSNKYSKRKKNYLKAVIIVHGKSELQMCSYFKQNLKLGIEIYSEQKGNSSIQINSINNVLNNRVFRSLKGLETHFREIEKNCKFPVDSFKIFIVMDTDDCTEEMRISYINKSLFSRSHWAFDYIFPIYQSPNLEHILTKAGIPFVNKGDKRKEEYIKIFPTESRYIGKEMIELNDLAEKLKKIKETNLDELLTFLIDIQ